MRRNAHVRFGGRAEETDGRKPRTAPRPDPYTYVLTREGWMYSSFLQDGFSRHILGFAARSSKGTELVTRTLLQAVNERQRSSAQFIANSIIVHSDAGSQLRFNRSSQHPAGSACGTTEGLEHDDDGTTDAAISGPAGLES